MWRKIRTAILFVAAVIVALNIENLAVFFGLDGTLVSLAQYIPIQLQHVWDFITAPKVLVTSIVVLAFAAGMRWDGFRKHQLVTREFSPEYRETLAQRWERTAQQIDVNADFYDTHERVTQGIGFALEDLDGWLYRELGIKVRFHHRNKAEALQLSKFLKDAGEQIRQENLGDLRQMIASYKAKQQKHSPPPNASPPKPSVPLDQQAQ